MNSISRIADTATHDQLVQEYEEAYVDFLDSDGNELEDRLQRALRVSDLAERMRAAGLEGCVHEIHESLRD